MLPVLLALVAAQADPVVTFESGPVRPVALSPDGTALFVANLPDGYLEVYDVGEAGLTHRGSVPVGLEPVTVVARSNDEVWVVNHLSDSVSVVDVPSLSVMRTLIVGDAPRDLVFANDRAFITTAHRGQHRTHSSVMGVPGAGDPQLTTPGVDRADVWVFDANHPGDALGGLPERVVTLFGDTPRGLAVSPDGGTVYAAVHHSGNRTTVVSEGLVCDGFLPSQPCTIYGVSVPGGNPGPSTNAFGAQAPEVGLIVKYDPDAEAWLDELDRDWSSVVRFNLPDHDVFAIDAATLTETSRWSGVGTTLFNLVADPVDGALYVTNTDAINEVRFEGHGVFGGSSVIGHLAEARVSVIDGSSVASHHLNPHIDYSVSPAPAGTADHSLATPMDVVVSSDGSTLYVAAYGSSRIGVIDTATLRAGTFDPTAASSGYLVTGGGPAGLALDEDHDRVFVYTRFDHAISVIDLFSGLTTQSLALPNPEPDVVTDGRPLLYDARIGSSNGEASCAACHPFGDMDHLSWDLGDPDAPVTSSTLPVKLSMFASGNINGIGDAQAFHPMKGPMTTQTLKGMRFSGAMHWRGDRADGFYGADPYDEDLSFRNFVVAFPDLLGRDGLLPDDEMAAFADFALTLALPPNPVRALDNSLTAAQQRALDFYQSSTRLSDGFPGAGFSCDGCHKLDPAQGMFGTDGDRSFENEPQTMKIAHLRNLYEKVGMFGMAQASFFEPGDHSHQGDQVRGYGLIHDGSTDTLRRFFHATVFANNGPDIGFQSEEEREDMESFMLAFDNDVAPIVGQQVTLDATSVADRDARLDLLVAMAEAPFVSRLLGGTVTQCDLIAKTTQGGQPIGFVFDAGAFLPDDGGAPWSVATLRAHAAAAPVTFTAVLPGEGWRRGVDRDLDGLLDGLDPCPSIPGPVPGCEGTGPGDTDDTDVADTDIIDTDPTDTDIIDTDLVDTDPANTDTDIIDTDPTDTDTVDTDPADTDPADPVEPADTDAPDPSTPDTPDPADTDPVLPAPGETSGCGCATGGGSAGWLAFGMVAALRRRRARA